MRAIWPQIKTVEQPVEFLDGQNDRLAGGVRRGCETLGLTALEPKGEAVAFPIQDLHAVAGFVETYEKQRIEYRNFYVQLDQCWEAVDGFSEVHWLGVEVHCFGLGVGSHHSVRAPERNREHSIENQRNALNVGFKERLTYACRETIYNAIYALPVGELRKELIM